jgi:hypothetical protein
MAPFRIIFVLIGTGILFSCMGIAGETITVAGQTYANAEMVEVAPDGAAYETEDGEVVILPWIELSSSQLSAIKAKYPNAIANAKYGAFYVKGSVFHVNEDGHIIQIGLADEEIPYAFKEGATVPKSGLVMVKDIPTSIPQGVGADIEIVAHKRKTYTFNIGIAAKEIPYLTVAKPLWAMEQEWINSDGKKMYARLVAVKGEKGLFEKTGKQFVYELNKLDDEGQKRARDIAEKLAKYPME